MNKKKLNFWLDLALVVLVIISGALVVALSGLHLALHWDWIKAVVFHKNPRLTKSVHRNRTMDLGLFSLSIPCTVAGIMVWILLAIFPAPLGVPLDGWRDLHIWTGVAMFMVMGIHLRRHWKWVASCLRDYLLGNSHPRSKVTHPNAIGDNVLIENPQDASSPTPFLGS
jgi:hypothetical protein